MMKPQHIIIEDNHLGDPPGGVTHVSPRRTGRPPPYGRQSPISSLTPVATGTSSNSPLKAISPQKASSSPPLTSTNTIATATTNTTLRNITSESENVQVYKPFPQGGFVLGKASFSQNSPIAYAGDVPLVSRLYGQIETKEAEFLQLRTEYQEEQQRLREEKKRADRLEKELTEAKEEIEQNKKRFANYRKQEREMRNKAELDQKEKKRDDIERWDATLVELLDLRRELAAKNQKLAEFEFMCMTLQQTLDSEKGKVRTELIEAENRIALSSKMLETCHVQLSRADKNLKKEKAMKEVLIQINQALQREIKRVTEQLNAATDAMKRQQLQAGIMLQHVPSMKQSSSESAEMYTNAIIQDLQIEDALFYFEEVKKQYEDRPKVYRIFLEIIRDYKSRKISTPEVIARIAKLFQGKSKLIIGFNRFLPKDFHVNQDDVAEMQSYNGNHDERYRVNERLKAKGKDNQDQKHLIADDVVPALETTCEGDSEQILVQHGIVVGVDAPPKPEEKENFVVIDMKEAANIKGLDGELKALKDGSTNGTAHNKDVNSTNESAMKNKRRSFSETRDKRISDKSRSHATSSLADLCSAGPASSFSLTISTSSSMDHDAARPSIKRLPGDMADDEEEVEDNATFPHSKSDSDSSTDGPDILSPTKADVASPTFDLNVVSTVGSSHVFGGIESIEDSFGVGILSVDQTTLYMPTDRYEVVEECEYNAIEVLAAHQYCNKAMSSHSSSEFYWTHRHA